ncbi:CAAX protease self-immunity [Flavobacterium micromati]|uniref:CAAX protease self-immunity n=1 Tax=Flavobacterium micromati TaxID=229205 RepID=A0A1M5L2M2_9FLAO|nr:CAAX protease self-immunity [Flavobacterium micromati]
MVQQINYFLNKLNFPKLVIIAVFCNLIISSIASLLSTHLIGRSINHGVKGFENLNEEFILVVFLAPILETLLFQYLIINFFLTKTKSHYACIISSFAFALQHLYNSFYFIFALFIGFIFAYLFIIGVKKNYGFILVATAHSLYNFIVFILKHFL